MRFLSSFAFLVALLPLLARARQNWDEIDFQIFDLNDALISIVGADATFYSILDSQPSFSISEINKSYRKVSRRYHPDKNQGDEKAEKIYQLLTSIMGIFKDQNARDKYDFHLKNGFPKWKGSGYYYARYKPGLFTVSVVILVFISFVQYASVWGIYYRDLLVIRSEESIEKKKVAKKSKKFATEVKRTIEDLQKPRITDVWLISLPLLLIKTITGNKASSESQQEKKDE
ncbi:hypothetical protein HK096_005518 [Nowakowskiella sp. JEL0078]|nr:hypothetical protein HK096_005518 [Nowakowskiella sp. JEL0078]